MILIYRFASRVEWDSIAQIIELSKYLCIKSSSLPRRCALFFVAVNLPTAIVFAKEDMYDTFNVSVCTRACVNSCLPCL